MGTARMVQVALATCRQMPNLDDDTRALIGPLARQGVHATPQVWNDPGVDWSSFALTVVRCCWDYHLYRPEFLTWAFKTPALANPAEVLAWNTNKLYLAELADAGVPVVPTTWLSPPETSGWSPPGRGDWVVKPQVSLAGMDTGRYDAALLEQRRLMHAHVSRLARAGRALMIQPYQAAVDTSGELAMVFLNGEFSHAVRKAAVLTGPDAGADHRFDLDGGLRLETATPTSGQVRLAQRALDAVPGGRARLLYARVDMVSDAGGEQQLMELELTEPQLFLGRGGAADRLAGMIAEQCQMENTTTIG